LPVRLTLQLRRKRRRPRHFLVLANCCSGCQKRYRFVHAAAAGPWTGSARLKLLLLPIRVSLSHSRRQRISGHHTTLGKGRSIDRVALRRMSRKEDNFSRSTISAARRKNNEFGCCRVTLHLQFSIQENNVVYIFSTKERPSLNYMYTGLHVVHYELHTLYLARSF